jgi:hypothetical protein
MGPGFDYSPHIREDDMSEGARPYYTEGARLTRKRSYTPRQDINEVKALLGVLEAEQAAKNLTKAPPNGKEKYLGNGAHSWEKVVGLTDRLRVPGGWIYDVNDGENARAVFVPLPSVLGYAV